MDETSRNGTCSQSGRQSVSQSAGNQKEEMDQQSPSSVRVRRRADGDGGGGGEQQKKSMAFWAGEKKGGDHVQSFVWRMAH